LIIYEFTNNIFRIWIGGEIENKNKNTLDEEVRQKF